MVVTLREKARLAMATKRRQANLQQVITSTGCGFVAGTRVVTPGGWATVESLNVGDEVLTFDAGFQRVTALSTTPIFRHDYVTPRQFWPIFVPAGVLENRHGLLVQPGEGVLVESPSVRDKWGDPYAVIPGAALDVLEGTYRKEPATPLSAVLPVFAEDHMVFVNGGALLFSQCIWGVHAGVQPRFGRAANYNMMPVQAAITMLESGAVRNVQAKPEIMLAAA
mmetsp:Transcript_28961/g.55439  ORF Transcript_28961/g.55439 Transcript_28961/m.55439 type:complete len:223 (+) Transcript_28961:167-835(+)